MKCTKCGYVSFDHLSECKKCRTSLTAARDGFGLHGAKPAVPFLLGALLSEHESFAQPENTVAEPETLTSFGFAEGTEHKPPEEKLESGAEEVAWTAASPDTSDDDFSLLDLSDEELDLLIEKESLENDEMSSVLPEGDANGTGEYHSQMFSSGEPMPSSPEISLPEDETPTSAGRAPEDVIQVSNDFPRGLESELETAPTLELVAESVDDLDGLEGDLEVPDESKPDPQQARPQTEGPTDDFVIELSENDLETLLEELGRNPKGAP